MANPLLDRAAPEFLAGRKHAIDCVEKISTFERLAGIVADDLEALPEAIRPLDWRESEVRIELEFGWADTREQLPQLTGRVTTSVPAVCQRCLEPCRIELDVALNVLLLRDAAAEPGDDALEIWELEEETLRPLDVVEELLVMALPMAAMHDDSSGCRPPEAESGTLAGDTVRPFAGLKARIDESR